jgi:hypothetical protein
MREGEKMNESTGSLLGIDSYGRDPEGVADDYTDMYELYDELLEECDDLSEFFRQFSESRKF